MIQTSVESPIGAAIFFQDGGVLALDEFFPHVVHAPNAPVALMVPGLGGRSKGGYVQKLGGK